MTSIHHFEERRASKRYRVRARVIFQWEDSRKDRFQGEGITKNISATGIYVLTSSRPPDDAILQAKIVFPHPHVDSAAEIKGEIRIVRVDHGAESSSRIGFSAVSKGFAFGLIQNETELMPRKTIKSTLAGAAEVEKSSLKLSGRSVGDIPGKVRNFRSRGKRLSGQTGLNREV